MTEASDSAAAILTSAQQEAAEIIAKAQQEAAEIVARAQNETSNYDPVVEAILREYGFDPQSTGENA